MLQERLKRIFRPESLNIIIQERLNRIFRPESLKAYIRAENLLENINEIENPYNCESNEHARISAHELKEMWFIVNFG